MKFHWFILSTILAAFPGTASRAQVYLSEGFEEYPYPPVVSEWVPDGWSQEYVVGPDEPWQYRNGGHTPDDPNWDIAPDVNDPRRNPPSAYEGTYNAIFFKQSNQNERTKLITPELDIEGGVNIELSFYLCQIPWDFGGSGPVNDVLRVYYKKGADSAWVLLQEYLDPVYDWELQTLVLPEPASTYYVAFEGQTRWGFGTCIDNVVIEEKGSVHRWIGKLDFQQPFTNYIPSGSSNVPMMRIDFKVFGNTDSAMLESIDFTSLNTSDADIVLNGVKLYSTVSQVFSTNNPLGTPTDFAGGLASFTNLNYSLPEGNSYVWLTYDIDPNATHGDILDAKVATNDLLANDTLYPDVEESPYGQRTVYRTLYSQDFEGSHGWNLTGEFEVNTPTGLGGSTGNPDPSEAFSGTKVLGTDLTGIGSHPYDYEPNLDPSTSYRATSPTQDVFYYKNLNLFYRRYLNIEPEDTASIYVSTDDGASWNRVYMYPSYVTDFQWTDEQISIPDQYSRTDQLKVRFEMGGTDGEYNCSGWNLDDFYLTGEFISKDAGVSKWIYPLSGSGHSGNDSVRIRIKNYGGASITDPVPVAYSFDGGAHWTMDIMDQNIPVGDSVDFTFPTKVDLSVPGFRSSVLARTNLPDDQYTGNDQVSTQIYIVPTYTPPLLENFETTNGYWRESGTELWEYGAPAGSVINSAASGSRSWATGLTEKYGDLITRKSKIILEDDFESSRGWTFNGEFERNIPFIEKPPYFAYSGQHCIGTDLVGQGDSLYKYENGITTATAYTATSPSFDVRNYSNLTVSYEGFLNIRSGDSARFEVSPDNGSTWYTLWENSGAEIMDEWYQLYEFQVHDSLSGSSSLKFRYSLYHSSASGWVAAGFYIDDFLFQGDRTNTAPSYVSSPSFDLTGLDDPVFESKLWWDTEPDVDGANLSYSLDDGETWTAITNSSGFDAYWNWYTGNPVEALGMDGWSGQSGGWLTVRHLLPSAAIGQENVQFRLAFMADKFSNQHDGIAFDDLQVFEAPFDLGVTEILSPVSACEISGNQAFTLRVYNYGIQDLQPGDSVRVGYYINRSGEIQSAEETYILTENFPVGSSRDITLSTEFDFDKSGDYQTEVFTIEADPYFYHAVANDTLSQVISVKKPAVELGPDIETLKPDTVVLNAYSGDPTDEYQWQDLSTDSAYHVSTEGTYYVTVSNFIGCVARDTVHVIRLIIDAGITSVLEPQSDCELGTAVQPKVKITNFGTYSLQAGDTIPLLYRIDEGTPLMEKIILAGTVYPDSSFEYRFTTASDLSVVKTYSIKAYTDMSADETRSNDSLLSNVQVYGYTPIDLGPDTVVRAFQYEIDAGTGYDSYLWQDGSTGQAFLAETTGSYRVTVKSGVQCENSDSVRVTLLIPDIGIERLSNPEDACGLSAGEHVEVYVLNRGTDTLNLNDSIYFTYQIDGGTEQFDTLLVDRKVVPGDSILFSSKGLVDMSDPGTYQFTVNATYSKDLIPENNNFGQSVEIYGYPVVSLGEDRIVNAKTDTLDPGTGYTSYLWQDGSTAQRFVVEYEKQTPGHSYSVIVTDANGCEAVDEVTVEFNLSDIGVVGVSSPVSACVMTDQEELRVLVQNIGTTTIFNEQIKIIASIDRGIPVTGQKTLTQALNPGDTLEFLFGYTFDFSAVGEHSLSAYSVYNKDSDPGNDTLIMSIYHYGQPDPDLGNGKDSLATILPYTLDAGMDYLNYTWNEVPGNRQYQATEYGWYRLEVTDSNGCTSTDSVFLMLSNGVGTLKLPGVLRVYPVPAHHLLNVEYFYRGTDDLFLEIFDIHGRKILIKEYRQVREIRTSIDVSGFEKGMYYLKLRSDRMQLIRQIAVQ